MPTRSLERFLPYFNSESLYFLKKSVNQSTKSESKKDSLSLRISRQFVQATSAMTRALPTFFLREKIESKINVQFQTGEDPVFQDSLQKFIQFDVHTKPPFETNPINPFQIAKAMLLSNHGTLEHALFENMLSKVKKTGATRLDFDEHDFKALDLVNFELIQEHFINLNQLFNSKILQPQATLIKEQLGIDLYESIIAETFAKSLAHNRNYHGKIIMIPVQDANGIYKITPFNISDFVLGDELPAYILQCTDPHVDPWIVIRGTESIHGKNIHGKEIRQGSGESVIADCIDSKGIARDIIIKSLVYRPVVHEAGNPVQKPSLLDIFEKWKTQEKKAKIAGHSLGGYLGIDLTLHMFDYIRQTYAFNAPGVSCKQFLKWENLVALNADHIGQSKEKIYSKIIQFNTEGDIVPSSGRKLIGLQFAVEPAKKFKKKDPIHDHLWIILSKNFAIYKIDNAKENQKLSRRITEKLRAAVGLTYRKILHQKQPDWWKNRKLYREALRRAKG